jgi:hypothetical protein
MKKIIIIALMFCSLFLLSSCLTPISTISSRTNKTTEAKTTIEAKKEVVKEVVEEVVEVVEVVVEPELFSWAKDSLGSDLYSFCLEHRNSEDAVEVSSEWEYRIGEISFGLKARENQVYFPTFNYNYVESDSYSKGFSSQPCYLVFSRDNTKDLVIVDVSSKDSYRGSLTVSAELAQFIMKCPISSYIKVYAYDEYNNRLYNSYHSRGDLYFEIKAEDVQKLITVYQVLYVQAHKLNSNDSLANKEIFAYSSSRSYLYISWSDNLRLENINNPSIQLLYKKWVNTYLRVGLISKPAKLLIKRTNTDESVVVEVDNSGVLKLNDNLIKFIYESPAGSKLKVEYYDSNGYRISWYSLDNTGSKVQNADYYDTINVNSAKKLIDFYCTYKNPLECWEINKEYTTNWILGLD